MGIEEVIVFVIGAAVVAGISKWGLRNFLARLRFFPVAVAIVIYMKLTKYRERTE